MVIRPTLSLSLQQRTAPKVLMRALVKLLPLNEAQLQDTIQKEVNENPFLSFLQTAYNTTDIENFSNDMALKKPSIYKIVLPQIESLFSQPKDLKIARHFLSDLDEDGFLREYTNPFEEYGIMILEKLQTMEPSGVFSRNLPEFYSNFLKAENKMTPLWKIFIESLDDIAIGNKKDVIQKMGTIEVFNAFLEDLKILPTHPNIDTAIINIVIPDIIVQKNKDSFSIKLNSNIHTLLNVDNDYVADVREHTLTKTEKTFIRDKFASAKWLKTALEMRAETLMNIATTLVEKQSDFLKGGDIKPLTMTQVATLTKVHVSSVSRIVNNKYMQTPIGTLSLKRFFCSRITEDLSQDTILKTIKNLVEQEKITKKILSDEKLAEALQQMSMPVARRTVAKYRILCNIESSAVRKRKIRLNS